MGDIHGRDTCIQGIGWQGKAGPCACVRVCLCVRVRARLPVSPTQLGDPLDSKTIFDTYCVCVRPNVPDCL